MKVTIRFTEQFEEAPGAIRMFGTPEHSGWEGWSMRCTQLSEVGVTPCVWGLMLEPQRPATQVAAPMILLQAPAKNREEWDRWLEANVEFIDFDGMCFFKGSDEKTAAHGSRPWRREAY